MPTHRSCAYWPPGTMYDGSTVTTDLHGDEKSARGVTELLRRNGFGGNHEFYPIVVWVEDIKKKPKPPPGAIACSP
jgi:hypothetical protein